MTNVKAKIIGGTVNGLPVGETIELTKEDFESLHRNGFVEKDETPKTKTPPRKRASEQKEETDK